MKVVVYLAMFLLLGPILRVAGVAVAMIFLVGMVVLGVYLLVRRTDRSGNGPQAAVQPAVVYVVQAPPCQHDAPNPAAMHPARQRPPLDGDAPTWTWGRSW